MSIATQIARLQENRNTIRSKLITWGVATNGDTLATLATTISGIDKQTVSYTLDAITKSSGVLSKTSYTIPAGYHDGTGVVRITPEYKEVTASTSNITVVPGNGKVLAEVTVSPTPTETLTVTLKWVSGSTTEDTYTPTSGKYFSSVVVPRVPSKYQDVSGVTAVAGDVLTGKKFVNSSGTLVTGSMPNNGAINHTLNTTTKTDGVLSNTVYTIPAGYHNGSGTVRIVPEVVEVSPSTEAQVITASTGKVLSEVSISAMPAGAYNPTVINHSITTAPEVTPKITGTVTSISTETLPSGTDGTDYWTLDPDGDTVNGVSSTKAKATITTAGYLATGNKSSTADTISITPVVNAGTTRYILKGSVTNNTTLPSGSSSSGNLSYNKYIKIGKGYYAADLYYKNGVSAGSITNNTTLPSGKTSSGTLNYNNYIKIGAGYYANDLYYAGQTDADLTAANIKTGVNILGVTGTFTADADATASHILSGKTAYVNGVKITGNIGNGSVTNNTTLPSGSTSSGNLNYDKYIKIGAGYYASDLYYKNGITAGEITNNTTIPSGSSSSGTLNYGKAIKVSAGYYANDLYYAGQTDSDLIAANIKTGVEILGVTGTFTADANAAAGHILSGKTAYVNGSKVTGSMANNGAVDHTLDAVTETEGVLSNTVYTIPAGYHDGTGKVKITPETIDVTPTTSSQTIVPSAGKVLAEVQVAAIPISTLTNSIIAGQAILESTNDYAWKTTVTVPAGYYNRTVLEKTFSDIFPSLSTDAATASEMLLGYKAYTSAGQVITGTMPNNGAGGIITLTTNSSQTSIAAGYWSSANIVRIVPEVVEVSPSTATQTITASTGKVLSEVTVNPMPDGDYEAAVTAHTITAAPAVTPKITGTVTSISTTTKPSGTDGTDYWTLDPDGDTANGTSSATAGAIVTTAGYLAVGSKSSTADTISITPAVNPGTNYYILKGSVTNNTTLPSGKTSSGNLSYDKYLKISSGYYPVDLYYKNGVPAGELTKDSGAVSTAAGNTSGLLGSGSASAPSSGYYITATGSGTVKVGTAGYLAQNISETSNSKTLYYAITEASPTFTGGVVSVSGSATATAGTGVTLSAANPSADPGSGIYIETGGSASANRTAITYAAVSKGYLNKAAGTEALAAPSSPTAANLTSNLYYITALTLPKAKTLTVTTEANTAADNKALVITNNAYRQVTVSNAGIVSVTSASSGTGNLKITAYPASGSTVEAEQTIVQNGRWVTPSVTAAGTYYGKVVVGSASPTFTGGVVSGSASATAAAGTGVTLSAADPDSDPGTGIYITTGGTASANRTAVTYAAAVSGFVVKNSGANALAAPSSPASITVTSHNYYITALTLPQSKTITVTTEANSVADNKALVVVNNAYRTTSVTNSINATLTASNAGTAIIMANSGTATVTSNLNGSTPQGTVKINAYPSGSGTTLVAEQTIVQAGRWVPQTITAANTKYYGEVTAPAGEIDLTVTDLPTGKTSSGDLAYNKYIKVSAGYYPADLYYKNGITEGALTAGNGSVSAAAGNTSGLLGSSSSSAPSSGSYIAVTGSGTVKVGTTGYLVKDTSQNSNSKTLYYAINTASPTFAGGVVSGSASATAAAGTGVTLSAADPSTDPGTGIYITTGGSASANRTAITYAAAVKGYLNKAANAEAMAAPGSPASIAVTSHTYYITALTLPKGKAITVTTEGNSSADAGTLTVNNGTYRTVSVTNSANGTVSITNPANGTLTASNAGTATVSGNSGTMTVASNGGTITVSSNTGVLNATTGLSSSAPAGNINITAYPASGTTLTAQKVIVEGGRWKHQTVAAAGTNYYGEVSAAAGTVTPNTTLPDGKTSSGNLNYNSYIKIGKGFYDADIYYKNGVAAGEITNNTTIPSGSSSSGTLNYGNAIKIKAGYYGSDLYYAGQTDADLTAANIKKGVEILGVTGTYTSDATAAAGHILSGKTAYVNGSKITGTIGNGSVDLTVTDLPSGKTSSGSLDYNKYIKVGAGYYSTDTYYKNGVAAGEITPNTTLPSGKTSSGTLNYNSYIKVGAGYYANDLYYVTQTDADLTAANIKKGVEILGVTGTFTSDATAAADKILDGYTAYVNGSKVTGNIADGEIVNNTTLPSGKTSAGNLNYDKYIKIGKGYYSADIYYKNGVASGTITPNTTLPSGKTSSGTLNYDSYIKIGAGYYANDLYYVTQTDADLIAGNIKKGVEILGVTGTYTDDATASTATILNGYTAYVNGSKVTGNIGTGSVALNTTLPSGSTSSGNLNYNSYIKIGKGYYSADLYYKNGVAAGAITPNTTLPSGSSSSGTLNYNSYIKIGAGYYANDLYYVTQTDADLVAANIKTGVNILGVTGTFTSDADAAAGHILSGKTAYVNGSKITGSMPDRGSVDYTLDAITKSSGTLSKTTYTIPAGYHDGTGTVKIVPEVVDATPTLSTQTIVPSAGKVLAEVQIAAIPVSALDNTIIAGQAVLESTNDYAWKTTVTLPAGYHSAQTIEKTFSDIFPSLSTDAATASEMLLGYKAYNSAGQVITGTMPNNGAGSTTRKLDTGTTSVDIAAGYWSSKNTVSITTQAKTGIDPTDSSQTITPDSGKVLSSVQINAISYSAAPTVTLKYGTLSASTAKGRYNAGSGNVTFAKDGLTGKAAHVLSGYKVVGLNDAGTAADSLTGTMTNNGAGSTVTLDGSTTSASFAAGYWSSANTVSISVATLAETKAAIGLA